MEGCTQAGGAKFFAEKYRRTRLEASKQVLLDLLCVAEPKNVRFALAWYRDTEDAAAKDPNGGYLKEDLGRSNPNHAAELEAKIKNTDVNSTTVEATPLSESLFQIYTYWMSRDAADIPTGADGVTKFPVYQYDKFGNLETNPSKYFDDTLLYDVREGVRGDRDRWPSHARRLRRRGHRERGGGLQRLRRPDRRLPRRAARRAEERPATPTRPPSTSTTSPSTCTRTTSAPTSAATRRSTPTRSASPPTPTTDAFLAEDRRRRQRPLLPRAGRRRARRSR